ncbi:MAG: hypothetical protein H6550_02880 [Chitinophagales bacterium]|nr:hypothetical protein [Chitinophagales bacterium]
MKRTSLIACALAICFATQAQIGDVSAAKKSAFLAAKSMDEAMVNKRYDDYAAFIHPRVLENVKGGRAGMTIQVAEQIKELEESGNLLTAVWPNMPENMLDTNGEWQCVLPQYMEYRLPEGKIKATTSLIGLSPDKGKTWYFLDVAERNLAQMRQLFPNLSSKLVIPAAVSPQFTADK